MKINNNYFMAV